MKEIIIYLRTTVGMHNGMHNSMLSSMQNSMHSNMHENMNKSMHNNMSDGRSEWPRTKAVEHGWSTETSECQTVEHRSG